MGMQPILPMTVPIKKIKDAALQDYGDGDGVVWCEQTFTCYTHTTEKSPSVVTLGQYPMQITLNQNVLNDAF